MTAKPFTAEQNRAYNQGFHDACAAASAVAAGYTDGDSPFDGTIARIADDIERLGGPAPIPPNAERMTGLCTDKASCVIATDLRAENTRLVSCLSETVTERDEARGAAVKSNRAVERMRGLLNEAQMHLLDRPMSLRAYADPKTLAARIETVLKETL